MPRGPRFAFEDSFYHVFNRGINKQDLYLSEEDFDYFLRKLLNLKQKYDFSLYAVCLMSTHFHLSIHTRKDSMSKIMASLLTSYSMYFNHKYDHYGSVFQSRFKSILVQTDSYFLKLSQYIYLNPVRAGLASDPLLYPYSTFAEACGKKPRTLLDSDISRLIGDSLKTQNAYEKYVYEGISSDFEEFDKLFEKGEGILGGNTFSTNVQRKVAKKSL